MNNWPDSIHSNVLKYLGSSQYIQGYLWPYCVICRSCESGVSQKALWRVIDLGEAALSDLAAEEILSLLRRRGHGVVETLILRGNAVVDDYLVLSFAAMLSGGPLRFLDLGNCPRVTGEVLRSLAAFPALEELSLECLVGLEDAHLAEICRVCPRLARLDVRYCEQLADASVFLRQTESWAALQLDGCFRLEVAQLLAQPPGTWRRLEELSLDGEDLGSQELARVAEVCPELRSLTVSFARELDPAALAALAGLSQLEALTMRKATLPGDNDWASFFMEQRSARAASTTLATDSQWRVLNVSECELFADGAAASLSAVPLPDLRELDLSWCWHLSDMGLSSIIIAAPGLWRIKVAGVKGLTARGLLPCCNLLGLEELDCTSCNSVEDTMLEFLHRLFIAPPGLSRAALPSGPLPDRVDRVAADLWQKRSRWAPPLQIKNYYAEYVETWTQLRPQLELCTQAELLLQRLEQATVLSEEG